MNQEQIKGLNLPQKFIQTLLFVKKIQRELPDYQITLTGHSLGGTYADFVAMRLGLLCESFNSCTNYVNRILFK